MNEALYIGATGMQAQQSQLDTIAHNLTNMNTPAFKASRVQFSEVIDRAAAGTSLQETPPTQFAGLVRTANRFDFTPGDLKQTGSAFDLAIQGAGFLAVALPDGRSGYTRGGQLTVDPNGVLATSEGLPLQPQIQLPSDAQSFKVLPDGTVQALYADKRPAIELGRLDITRFSQPEALESRGGGVYLATTAAGDPVTVTPGLDGGGSFAQGFTETANVKLIDEMTRLMLAQRAYEIGSKLVQAADEIMGMTNSLRK
jgi:flagellar basal-body rod protein FlgG